MSEAKKDKKRSAETCQKISESQKGKPSHKAKPFVLLSPEGEIVECKSSLHCSKATGLSLGSCYNLRLGFSKSVKGWRLALDA